MTAIPRLFGLMILFGALALGSYSLEGRLSLQLTDTLTIPLPMDFLTIVFFCGAVGTLGLFILGLVWSAFGGLPGVNEGSTEDKGENVEWTIQELMELDREDEPKHDGDQSRLVRLHGGNNRHFYDYRGRLRDAYTMDLLNGTGSYSPSDDHRYVIKGRVMKQPLYGKLKQ